MEYEVVDALVEAQYQRARLEDALTREQSQIDDPVQGMKPEPIPRIREVRAGKNATPSAVISSRPLAQPPFMKNSQGCLGQPPGTG